MSRTKLILSNLR